VHLLLLLLLLLVLLMVGVRCLGLAAAGVQEGGCERHQAARQKATQHTLTHPPWFAYNLNLSELHAIRAASMREYLLLIKCIAHVISGSNQSHY
jgi:hypothetical protein